MPEVRIYTYGDTGIVMVKVAEMDVPMEQPGQFRRLGAFVVVCPPADKQVPEAWAKLGIFMLGAYPLSDPLLRWHTTTLGEHLVIDMHMPKEIWKVINDYDIFFKDEFLDWFFKLPYGSTTPFVLGLERPLEFPDQIKRLFDQKDPQFIGKVEPLMKQINGERVLDGVPEKWLEDYYRYMRINGERDTPRAKEVREFIDTYDHYADEDDH